MSAVPCIRQTKAASDAVRIIMYCSADKYIHLFTDHNVYLLLKSFSSLYMCLYAPSLVGKMLLYTGGCPGHKN